MTRLWAFQVGMAERWIPKTLILHPYPNERFFAKHPG
jgi:hypothetical protein